MRLTKKEFCDGLELYKKMLNQESTILESLGGFYPEWIPGDWLENYLKLFIQMCDSEYADDYICWFCFDTDFGQNEKDRCEVIDTNTGRTWNINSPEILYDFITEEE